MLTYTESDIPFVIALWRHNGAAVIIIIESYYDSPTAGRCDWNERERVANGFAQIIVNLLEMFLNCI